jgi:hypothetical protein
MGDKFFDKMHEFFYVKALHRPRSRKVQRFVVSASAPERSVSEADITWDRLSQTTGRTERGMGPTRRHAPRCQRAVAIVLRERCGRSGPWQESDACGYWHLPWQWPPLRVPLFPQRCPRQPSKHRSCRGTWRYSRSGCLIAKSSEMRVRCACARPTENSAARTSALPATPAGSGDAQYPPR